jgi:hypothetical protein
MVAIECDPAAKFWFCARNRPKLEGVGLLEFKSGESLPQKTHSVHDSGEILLSWQKMSA